MTSTEIPSSLPAEPVTAAASSCAQERDVTAEQHEFRTAFFLNAVERALDFITVICAVCAAYGIYLLLGDGKRVPQSETAILAFAAAFALVFVLLLERHGEYRAYVSLLRVRETERLLRVSMQSFLFALLIAYVLAIHVSRLVFLCTMLTVPVFLATEKWSVYHLIRALRNTGYGTRRAIIYGTGSLARQIFSTLAQSPKFGLEPVAFVADDPDMPTQEIYALTYHRGRQAKVLAGPLSRPLFQELRASVLVIALPNLSIDAMRKLADEAAAAGASCYFTPVEFSDAGAHIEYTEIDGIMLGHLTGERPRLIYDIGKRSLDIAVSLLLLAVFSLLWVIVPILIKLTSPGPVLFRQDRIGKDGKRFSMLKFRSMFAAAPQYAFSPKASEDPRVTPIGRLLRRTSLDEFPQFINVLLGHMSLVGPRPEMPFLVEQYSPLEQRRLAVKPGITGLWQMSADRASLIHENMEYDLYYVRHRNLFMDVAILLHTLPFVARGV